MIYLVEPTTENIRLISSDLQRSLYQTAYVNFLSYIPRPMLEEFAAKTAQDGTSDKIAQVYDQYLNFIVSEPDLFSLGLKDVYYTLNSAQIKDDVILESCVDRIVGGLFSLVATLGVNLPSTSHIPRDIVCLFLRQGRFLLSVAPRTTLLLLLPRNLTGN